MNTLFRVCVIALSVALAAYLVPGVHVAGPQALIVVSIVLALLYALVWPLLILLTLPAVVFSLGLFLLPLGAFVVMLAAKLVPGFAVDGFWPALWVNFFAWLLGWFFGDWTKRHHQ